MELQHRLQTLHRRDWRQKILYLLSTWLGLAGRADIDWNNRIGWYEGFHQLLSVTSVKRHYSFWLICWNGSRCSVFHTNRLSYHELDMIEAIRPTGGFPEADYAACNANNAGSTS